MIARILAVALLFVGAPALAASQDLQQRAERFAGRRVSEVLRELQARGAPITFSDSLVGPDLRVTAEPRRTLGMRELAEAILAPQGLALANGPRNSWVVVRASKPPRPLRTDRKLSRLRSLEPLRRRARCASKRKWR